MQRTRNSLIDALRALAIVLMIFFHATFDLDMQRIFTITESEIYWQYLPNLIVTLFFMCVGLSMVLVYQKQFSWRHFLKREGKLLLAAMIITLVTYLADHKKFIYFGTLHSIFICSILAIPFLRRPWTAITLATLIITAYLLGVKYPWFTLHVDSLDYIPPLPWFSAMLLGIFLAHQKRFLEMKIKSVALITNLSKNSLLIYLIHQPVLLGIVTLIKMVQK